MTRWITLVCGLSLKSLLQFPEKNEKYVAMKMNDRRGKWDVKRTSQVTYVTIVPWEQGTRHCVSWPCFGHSCWRPLWKKRMTCSTCALLCPQTLICLRHRLPPANVKCIVSFYSCFRDRLRWRRNLRRSLPKGTSTLRPLEGAMGTLCQRRHAEGKSVQKLDS